MLTTLQKTERNWRTLAKGNPDDLRRWLPGHAASGRMRALICVATICFGGGCYGASIGLWNGAEMAAYVGIKLPFIIFITLGLNALINGMLAQIFGSGLGFKQTLAAQLISFAVFALIVGSLSPITAGMAIDLPGPNSDAGGDAHKTLLLFHTVLIAFAGVIANAKLLSLLKEICPSPRIARATLFSWLAGNLFLGAQISFLLRPIFGQPGIKIQFLRPDLFTGNFYESVWWALTRLSQ